MSWSIILADLADVLKSIQAGKGVAEAIKAHGFDECMLYFKCTACGANTYMKIKPVLDRHAIGQMPSLPSRCNDDNCGGKCTYEGVY